MRFQNMLKTLKREVGDAATLIHIFTVPLTAIFLSVAPVEVKVILPLEGLVDSEDILTYNVAEAEPLLCVIV